MGRSTMEQINVRRKDITTPRNAEKADSVATVLLMQL